MTDVQPVELAQVLLFAISFRDRAFTKPSTGLHGYVFKRSALERASKDNYGRSTDGPVEGLQIIRSALFGIFSVI